MPAAKLYMRPICVNTVWMSQNIFKIVGFFYIIVTLKFGVMNDSNKNIYLITIFDFFNGFYTFQFSAIFILPALENLTCAP